MSETGVTSGRISLVNALTFAFLGALLAAVGHGLFVLLRVFVMHKFSWTSRDILWTGTLSYALYIVPLTLLVWVATRPLSARVHMTATIATPLAIAGLGVLLLTRAIHPLALFLLSLGVAIRIATWVWNDPTRRTRLARRLTIVMAIGCVIVSGVIRGSPMVGEWRAMGRATPASEDTPNVLFIILDTVRAASMGMYGYKVPNTPNLERLAAEGVKFNWAFSPASWTLPSHASMFTGLDARATRAGWRRSFDGSAPTIGEHLGSRGLVSGGFVANKSFTTWETGIHRGFHRWDDIGASPMEIFWAATFSQTPLVRDLMGVDSVVTWTSALKRFNLRLSSESKHVKRSAADIVNHFLGWQSKVGDGRYFAFLNLIDAHDPYEAPAPWDTKWVANPKGQDHYDASIGYMDQELGRLFAELKARGTLDRTLVIVSSDHGELFGEHNLSLHGRFLYLNSIHVPLVIRFPAKVPAGRVVTAPVSLDRIPATILEILGDSAHAFPGVSLRAAWGGATQNTAVLTAESWVEQHPWAAPTDPAARGSIASVADSMWHWLHNNGDGVEELYRYRDDVVEATDHSKDPDAAAIRGALRSVAERRKLLK